MDRMEKPDWNRWDTLKSLRDLGSLALDTIVDLIPMNFEIKDEDDAV